MTLTIELPEDKIEAIQTMAEEDHSSIDRLVENSIDQMMLRRKRIDEIGEHLLEKNAELYRRLA